MLRTTPEEVEARVAALLDERRGSSASWPRRRRRWRSAAAAGRRRARPTRTSAGVKFSGQVIEGLDAKELRGLLDEAKQRLGSGVAAIVAVNDGRGGFAVAVTDDLTGRFSAVELVRAGVEALGGKGGGGRPDMAQGGGPDGAKAAEAIAAVRAALAGSDRVRLSLSRGRWLPALRVSDFAAARQCRSRPSSRRLLLRALDLAVLLAGLLRRAVVGLRRAVSGLAPLSISFRRINAPSAATVRYRLGRPFAQRGAQLGLVRRARLRA